MQWGHWWPVSGLNVVSQRLQLQHASLSGTLHNLLMNSGKWVMVTGGWMGLGWDGLNSLSNACRHPHSWLSSPHAPARPQQQREGTAALFFLLIPWSLFVWYRRHHLWLWRRRKRNSSIVYIYDNDHELQCKEKEIKHSCCIRKWTKMF